ncbi:MAG: hypothetical protein AB8G18_12360 [Gammaproteobacteria bacterium]
MKSFLNLMSVFILLVCIVAGLAAFEVSGTEPENQMVVDAASKSKSIHGPHGETDRFAPSKPMSVVRFVKPERYLADSGETVTINLTIMASAPIEAVTLSARAEKGVVISARSQSLGELAPGEEREFSFDVTVLEEGRHYINVLATAETLDGVRQSTYSVPIEVGDARRVMKKAGQTVIDDQGNVLVLMPGDVQKGDEQPR